MLIRKKQKSRYFIAFLISLLCICSLSIISYAEFVEFRNGIEMGDHFETVKRKETLELEEWETPPNDMRCIYSQEFQGDLFSYEYVNYSFKKGTDKLFQVEYALDFTKTVEESLKLEEAYQAELEKLYGKPEEGGDVSDCINSSLMDVSNMSYEIPDSKNWITEKDGHTISINLYVLTLRERYHQVFIFYKDMSETTDNADFKSFHWGDSIEDVKLVEGANCYLSSHDDLSQLIYYTTFEESSALLSYGFQDNKLIQATYLIDLPDNADDSLTEYLKILEKLNSEYGKSVREDIDNLQLEWDSADSRTQISLKLNFDDESKNIWVIYECSLITWMQMFYNEGE